mmetsp:Transcript_41369/g.69199  ORF Transcript_41369/g.69199 Transcript_41369/m.69199 type:complete len:268 (-) Transcript_41369:348-1151(-)|eukprot:CAMPEP_0198215904 /NCGR_PEP_ID=MMETSP1445-20131203/53414_1 /TAXON_ID=36898 /ORGANISM="Pyramimonas sp., Strain CCMP2087" /LENGTH=267 /DNA_ID=CAMNT_0043891861 /DNA_START=68 /DNA_END=871 /DNA_ORIENTATION=-
MTKVCDHCGEEKPLKLCSKCKLARYCGHDCQASAWKTHKKECKKATQEGAAAERFVVPGNATWANGLSPDKQYEWLCDCYRMRMDDAYCWGGGELRGVMNPEATPESVSTELFVFCKLAVKNKVVPPHWNWEAFLAKAIGLVIYAFEKSDAKEKYGRENVFSVFMGGRSLRATGETIYGSSVTGDSDATNENAFLDAVESCMLFGDHEDSEDYDRRTDDGSEDNGDNVTSNHEEEKRNICANVGGIAIWENFVEQLTQNPGPNLAHW